MAKLQKFLFDLDFDAPIVRPDLAQDLGLDDDMSADFLDEEEEEPPPPPPPTFSEEDLMLARDTAMEAGRQAGLREAEATTERLLALSLGTIADTLRQLDAAQTLANEDRLRDSVAVALAVVRKILPEMSRDKDLEEIAAIIRECLTHIEKDVRVTVRVNPDHLDGIRDLAAQAAEETGFEGKLVYTADPLIAQGDCRVEWGDGGVERDQERLWTEIDATISRALGPDAGWDIAQPPEEEDAVGP